MSQIGEAFRIIRVINGLKIVKLSEILGISQSAITAIESGRKTPSLETITLFANSVELSPSQVLRLSDSLEVRKNHKFRHKIKLAIQIYERKK